MGSVLGLRIATLVIGLIAFIFIATTPGGRYWRKKSVLNIDTHKGLWDSCVNDVCVGFADANVPDYVEAVRAMTIVSTIFAGVALIFSIIMIIPKCCEHIKIFDLVQFLLYLAAALFEFLSIVVYAAEQEDDGADYGWTFILGCLGFIFAIPPTILAMVLFCMAQKTHPSDRELQTSK